MNKPTKISLLLLIVLLSSMIIYVTVFRDNSQGETQRTSAQSAALNEANLYQPDETCEQLSTAAEHSSSGAQYTFETACLPDGWTTIENESITEPTKADDQDTEAGNTRTEPGTAQPIIPQDPSEPVSDDAAREAALEQARNYRPKGACTTVMTPARHTATGATYTFPSGCLPEGWVRTSSGETI